MDGMSDIRNEIEQRLGVFARPGAKAAFGIAQVWLTQTESGRETARKIRANLNLRPSLSDRDLDRAFTMLINLYDRQDRDTGELRQYAAEWKKFNSSRPGAKAKMAMTPIRVTETEYAALAARDAVSRKILGDSQYQITSSDRTVRAAGDAAYKTALARHNAWDKAWKDAPNDAARAEIEARTEAAEAGMRVYRGSRPSAKATMGKYWVEDGQSNVKQPVKSMREGIQLVSGMHNGVLRYADHGMTSILAYGRGSGGASLTEDGKLHQKHASARNGEKATFASPGIVVKEDAQYIYYYPDEDDRATFADADGKGAYTVKSNRTGKPVSAKTYRSWDEAVSASNAMNEKLPPLKKRKGFSRPGAKSAMARISGSSFVTDSGQVFQIASWMDLSKASPAVQETVERAAMVTDNKGKGWELRIRKNGSFLLRVPTTGGKTIEGKMTASRPGAKAEMGKYATELGWIASQAKDQPELAKKNIRVLAKAMNKDPEQRNSYDLTDMRRLFELGKQLGMNIEVMNLYESGRHSRPGAKAKFGSSEIDTMLNMLASQVVDQKDLARKNAKKVAEFIYEHGTVSQIEKFLALANRVGLHESMARSGTTAKANMGLEDACWKGYEAVGMKTKDGKDVPNCVPKATAAKPEIEETEQDKAGLKLMEKADKAVSDKIRTLIKEGKPQDQAVAIALDMKRRGEL